MNPKKVSLVEFRSLVPDPAKGVQTRSNFHQAFAFEEGFREIYRTSDGVLISSPKLERSIEVPWANVSFVEYGPEVSQKSIGGSKKKDPAEG